MNVIDIQPQTYLHDANTYFLRLQVLEKCVWLDSGKPSAHHGRFDILTAAPREIYSNARADHIHNAVNTLFQHVDTSHAQKLDLPFYGGAIGYFNYEYNHTEFALNKQRNNSLERNNSPEQTDSPEQNNSPERTDSLTGIFDWCLIQDHHTQTAYTVFLPSCCNIQKKRIINILNPTSASNTATSSFTVTNLQPSITKRTYVDAINKIHNYIINGDTYQINFAQRFKGEFHGSAHAAYTKLRASMPSPFSAYIDLSNEKILSFSPERFIHIDQGHAFTQPIKGTIRRSQQAEEDAELALELQHSVKNRAENLMIVDLLRNDFNKHCDAHSVTTPKLFHLESFSNVHHLVSTVCGKLKNTQQALAFLLNCFPGGSITGAPKKRAMEIIDELEAYPRNIYCGSIYYLTAHNKLDSNITIRTVSIRDNTCICWGGGGIVADSTAEEEYQESLQKIQTLLDALSRGTQKTQ